MIELRHSTLEIIEGWGAKTYFSDGSTFGAHPHRSPHYYIASHRAGCGDNVLLYCQHHELAHLVIEEELYDRPSQIIWGLAHGRPLSPAESVYEEQAAMMLQRWAMASERPMIGPGIDWDRIKRRFLKLAEKIK